MGTTTTTVSSDGISIQGKDNSSITLSKDGLNVGGKVISNVGKGTKDTDAANVQQLNEVRNLLGLGNAGNDNADGNQVNIADIKKTQIQVHHLTALSSKQARYQAVKVITIPKNLPLVVYKWAWIKTATLTAI